MNKTIFRRSLASVLSVIMAFSTAIPSSFVYAEEAGIVSEIVQDLTATLSQTTNGTVSFVSNGNETQETTIYAEGDDVEVAVNPEDGFSTSKIEIKDAAGLVVASLEDGLVTETDGIYHFVMPDSNVTVDVIFEEETEITEVETETTEELVEEEPTKSETEAPASLRPKAKRRVDENKFRNRYGKQN